MIPIIIAAYILTVFAAFFLMHFADWFEDSGDDIGASIMAALFWPIVVPIVGIVIVVGKLLLIIAEKAHDLRRKIKRRKENR